MFRKILIANRGEIACRIARTARRLGVKVVAVYSDADAEALHVACADEAWPVGPPPARESYLDINRILEIADRAGAEAIHPGYGFLAENADFAAACIAGGFTFIGPSPRAMRLMGSKSSAKALVARAGAPIVPGFHAEDADDATLAREAEALGFPLLVKATAGGGGRGMRIVRAAADFAEAVSAARREAHAAFGDGRVLIEKYLERPRHIEVQILADIHGGVIVFPERDCSIQRHHQKIIEETPAPHFADRTRRAMNDVAITAARSVDYVGAGTVEFLVKNEKFYFLEMNTRLQVEHPVTEMISGIDLVEWQLRVACGERLPPQDSLKTRGAAVEARVCAEDPGRDFLPSVGLIEHFSAPREGHGVRVDAGVHRGDRVTPHYDSLIAKLVVWADDRDAAVRKLQRALANFEIVGVDTNLDLLRRLGCHPCFLRGEYDTGFIEQTPAYVNEPDWNEAIVILAAAAAMRIEEIRRADQRRAMDVDDPFSPWAAADGWRLRGSVGHEMLLSISDKSWRVNILPLHGNLFRLETPMANALVDASPEGDHWRLRVDGVARTVGVVAHGKGYVVIIDGRNHVVEAVDPLQMTNDALDLDVLLSAPIPAKVTRVLVSPGERVKKGAPLVVLEAMKMEFTLSAPRDGVIENVCFGEGQMAPEGAQIVALTEAAA